MKLRNKKTGEIVDIKDALRDSDDFPNHYLISDDWEDYEEPKKFWWINERLTIYESEVRDDTIWLRDACKQTGNYFLSREEAEKAIEKLKAWKRLKDKGFKLCNCIYNRLDGAFVINLKDPTESYEEQSKYLDDIELLFGGEE